jgi:ribonuclease T1
MRIIHFVFVGMLLLAGAMGAGFHDASARDARPVGEISLAQLPAEARATLTLIRKGGPYPYRQDGTRFGNRERLLPQQSRDYYSEYTVRTPGSRDRGARRIVAGGSPPTEFFYTADHYRSFKRIKE